MEAKKNKLAAIQDEVKEFHPLLEALLPKLPDIQNIDYSHGKDEMGADFILSKLEKPFGILTYIGVIAKIGKIKQNFSEIERQIADCSVSRYFLGTKDRINIEEIWVITNEHITSNAQEKIHEKYKNRKIIFISGSALIRLIDDYLPHYWTNIPIKINEYLKYLRTTTEEADKRMNLYSESFYIEQDVYHNYDADYSQNNSRKRQSTKVEVLDEIEKRKVILIEGGMGTGKSKMIRRLIDYYTKPEVYVEKNIIPICLDYKSFVEKNNGDPDILINSVVSPWEIGENNLKYLLLIDGVDEMNQSNEERKSTLKTIIDAVCLKPNVKLLLTCRYIKGLDKIDYFESKATKLELRPLTMTKTIEFLRRLCQKLNIADRILEDLKRSPLIQDLPRTPIAAIILARLLNENSSDLPSNLPELYSKYTEQMLGRWDMEKGLQSQKEYQALDNILMQFSKYVIENEINLISKGDLQTIFTQYLAKRNFDIIPDDLFKKMVERCEIIYFDEMANTLSFKHRTFAEFFYAKSLSKKNALAMDNRAFNLYWTYIYYFYLGIQKDCEDELCELTELNPENESKRWLKIVNMSNFYLAAYATEYKIIAKGLAKMATDAAYLYKDIIGHKFESIFSKLSIMNILCFLQLVFRQAYAYDYFKSAIVDAALIINEEDSIENDIKAYATFLLNVTLIDLKGTDSFDFLLKDYIKHLPVDLALAIGHESKDLKESKLMKKQDRLIRGILKRNRSLNSKINEMYERPIGTRPQIKNEK
jgi:hypothetical protein